jgi:hypothetical protein
MIQEIYDRHCRNPSDINEHLPVLRRYASMCKRVTEFGTCTGVSTAALAMGCGQRLVTYDIVSKLRPGDKDAIMKDMSSSGREFVVRVEDVLKAEVDGTDLLFIDSLHTYRQISMELGLHGGKAEKFIICHDTETFGDRDEIVHASSSPLVKNGASPHAGLNKAIDEFMADNPAWRVITRLKNNNGLTIMGRGL